MPTDKKPFIAIAFLTALLTAPVPAVAEAEMLTTADHSSHQESAAAYAERTTGADLGTPLLPEGISLEEVLEYSARIPPPDFPDPVPDDRIYVFTLVEKLEYRSADDDSPDHLGWEAQGWIGGDFNKFWWKNEGEAVFEGTDEGESETDLLYSRLITPFWNFQAGVQYTNEWAGDDYEDLWSAALAVQGMVPYMFELDNSLYLSEDGDLIFKFEAEYDLRITQRLVLQPLVAAGFSAQEIPERNLGDGMTDGKLELRLRYEIKREFAPYLGLRYRFLVGETEDLAEAAGADTEQFFFFGGMRFAF